MRLQRATLVFLTLASIAWSAAPRASGQVSSGQVFRAEAELVTLSATVRDRRGRPIGGLTKDDFVVADNDQRQDIALFSQDADTPLSVVLLVDVSGSMVDKLDNVEDALHHFIASARDDDEIALIEFSSSIDKVSAFGADRSRLTRSIRNLDARGGTALYDAVIEGLGELATGKYRKKVLLLLTDGNDTDSRADRGDAVKAVIRSEALVYALGLGHGERGSFGHDLFSIGEDTVDIRALRALAEPSGGRAELIENPHGKGVDLIDQTLTDFERELREQYTLAYYPTPPPKDDEVRRVRVTTRNSDYAVRARTSYRRDSSRSQP